MSDHKAHEVAITAIIVKDGKYLIVKRADAEEHFPGVWLVPGGRLEREDYEALPQDTDYGWYNVLERVLKREVKEEVGLEINEIEYLTSIATVHGASGRPLLIISCLAEYAGGDIVLAEDEHSDYAWVGLGEAKQYELLDGVYDELVMAEKHLRGEKSEWQRSS